LFTTAAFILQAAAFGNYFAQVEPVNVRFRRLAPGQVPSDFLALRGRWEYGHALYVGLFTAALILLGTRGHPSPERLSTVNIKIAYHCRPHRKSDVFTIGVSS
jgi:hypothetical protein